MRSITAVVADAQDDMVALSIADVEAYTFCGGFWLARGEKEAEKGLDM